MFKILIAEDDANSRNMLKKFLEARNYQLVTAANGAEALELFTKEAPDLILLDVMMPKLDGWSVLQKIREISDAPVIMVTVKDSTDDKVKGFDLGVDDYIVKPFDLREVEARVEAVMRRYKTQITPVMKIGDLTIDDERKEVKIKDKLIELSPKEYELLKLLAGRPGKVFSHEEILKNIWVESSYATSEDVKKYIYLLRNKIEKDPDNPQTILTVRGFGYKLAT